MRPSAQIASGNATAAHGQLALPDAEQWSAEAVLRWGLEAFHPGVAIASSFGAEDVVLIDIASRVRKDVRIFTLDTDFLFPETYDLIGRISSRYGVHVDRVRPELGPEQQAERHGEALWSREPDQCCDLRKVQPLQKALFGLHAWVTGVRRQQSPTRAHTKKIESDHRFGLVKLNPLADWTSENVWDYIRRYDVPFNPLHQQGYRSIGCTHCTRPVAEGEDERAGRWAGFNKTECGLHPK